MKAIAFLNKDVSAEHQERDEHDMKACAGRLGYTVARTYIGSDDKPQTLTRALTKAGQIHATAVIVPSWAHLDGAPKWLREVAIVITVRPEGVFGKTTGARLLADGA